MRKETLLAGLHQPLLQALTKVVVANSTGFAAQVWSSWPSNVASCLCRQSRTRMQNSTSRAGLGCSVAQGSLLSVAATGCSGLSAVLCCCCCLSAGPAGSRTVESAPPQPWQTGSRLGRICPRKSTRQRQLLAHAGRARLFQSPEVKAAWLSPCTLGQQDSVCHIPGMLHWLRRALATWSNAANHCAWLCVTVQGQDCHWWQVMLLDVAAVYAAAFAAAGVALRATCRLLKRPAGPKVSQLHTHILAEGLGTPSPPQSPVHASGCKAAKVD